VYTPAFHEKYAICLPSCDLIMCQSSFTGGEPLSPVQLYAMDDYCMNHWSLLFQISPSISLGSFPLEECKAIKLPLPVDILFASTAVVDQDKDVCTSRNLTHQLSVYSKHLTMNLRNRYFFRNDHSCAHPSTQ
jgi:hypothetical protein